MNNKETTFTASVALNDAVYNVRPLALILERARCGPSFFAYEDLVTGKAKDLETKTLTASTALNNPPRFMPDEA